MGYAFSQWFWSFSGEILVAVVIGVAAMIWGIFEGAKRWSAAVNGLVVVAAILVIANQSGWWEPSVKVKIHMWLDDVSFSIREMPLPEKDDLEFRYEVTFEVGENEPHQEHKFYVQQPKKLMKGFVILEAGLDAEGSFPGLKKLNEKEINLLRRQIIKDLMLKGVELIQKDSIYVMRFKYFIPLESLTQQELARGYYHLWHSQLIAANDIGLALEK